MGCPIVLNSQNISNHRILFVTSAFDTIKLDSLSIIPTSLCITDSSGGELGIECYWFDYIFSLLKIDTSCIKPNEKIVIRFRVFPYDFSASFSHKDKKRIEPGYKEPWYYSAGIKKQENIFEFGDLQKNGSISRGISFGNNQDVVVNSNLNLQLAGKLSNDVEILAAITDNNIPIQPEGNTQQIQEFDKVFIQLAKDRTKLVAGDFEMKRPESYFMNFYKKAQGGHVETKLNLIDTLVSKRPLQTLAISASGAVSKGKFARNTIIGREGNQGPYKLTGSNNESYIIVLAGSERVFVDGVLLNRGQSEDYVIDYNMAELTFTPKNIITKDKRIVIEFEYSDKNYARSVFHVGTTYDSEKFHIVFNVFSEQDIKTQPIQQELNNQQKKLLSEIGDSLYLAVVPTFDSVSFSVNEVLYKMVDTLAYDSIFVHSTNPDSAFYRLSFSNVGMNKGNYVQIKSTANGRVFKWVAPSAGIPQGSFEPVILLITPKQKQMFTLSAGYNINTRTKAKIELATSKNDINTFSDKNKGNDEGYAFKVEFLNLTYLKPKDSTGWRLISSAGFEWVDKHFSPLERFRAVEFERDWNLNIINIAENENIAGLNLRLEKPKRGFLNYGLNSFLKGNYKGFQNQFTTDLTKNNYRLNINASLVNSSSSAFETRFIKHQASLSKKLPYFTIGIKQEQEHNLVKLKSGDSILSNSFSFSEFEGYIMNSDTSVNKYSLSYKKRFDWLPFQNSLKKATTADNFGLTYNYLKNPDHSINTSLIFRQLTINDTNLFAGTRENHVVGRVEYFARFLKGFISSNLFYEVGSGLEIKKEFSYLEVPSGQGVYYWNVNKTDYNGNGILDLDEVEVAVFADQANYIRIFTPTSEFEKVFTNVFSEALNFNPALLWKNPTGLRKALSRFSNQLVYRIDHKTTDKSPLAAYNPFIRDVVNPQLLALNSVLRNTVYFNRTHPKFGMDFNIQDSKNRILLVNGLETRTQNRFGIRMRWNISKTFSFESSLQDGKRTNSSEFYKSRDYNIYSNEAEPVINFQPSNSIRFSILYKYSVKENKMQSLSNEKAFTNRFGTEIKYNIAQKGTFLMKANYILINYNSAENTSLAFEMLEGLKKGKNGTWNLSYQRTLSNNLQLSILYDGRKSEGSNVVHIGSMQLRAFF